MIAPPTLARRVGRRVAARRDAASLLRALGEHMGAAARDPANLAERRCPVCASGELEPPARAIRGPVYAFHRCRGCTLIYAPRVLRPEATRRLYAERPIYRAYWEHMRADAAATAGREVFGELVERLLAAVPGRDAAIDVGCGFGKLVAELTPHFREVVGLELNRRTARAGAELFGVELRSERLERLRRPESSVDLVVMNQVLEHLADVRGVVEAAHRLLRPGGVLWIGIPHGASLGMRLLGGAHRFVATHVHVNLFTAAALRVLAERTGFTVRALASTDGVDLSAADWVLERVTARTAPLLAAPALALDRAARRAAAVTSWPSRLGLGSHLEALLVKPRPGEPPGEPPAARRRGGAP